METPSGKPKRVSIYSCSACGEVKYKLVRKSGWFRMYCPHCGVQLSTNLLWVIVSMLGALALMHLPWNSALFRESKRRALGCSPR